MTLGGCGYNGGKKKNASTNEARSFRGGKGVVSTIRKNFRNGKRDEQDYA